MKLYLQFTAYKKCLLLFLFSSLAICTYAQYNQDLQLRTGVKFSKTFKKDYTFSAQYQVRAGNFLTNFRGSFITLGFEYKVNKYFSAEVGYRYSTSNIRDSHRFFVSGIGKYKFGDFTLTSRLTYQRQHPYFNNTYESGNEPTNYIRNRTQLKWDFVKHWDTYISIEPFYLISNEFKGCDRVRTIAGLDYTFKKNHTINLWYMFQPDVNQANPDMVHAIGLMYEWDIPKFKKKKDKDAKKG